VNKNNSSQEPLRETLKKRISSIPDQAKSNEYTNLGLDRLQCLEKNFIRSSYVLEEQEKELEERLRGPKLKTLGIL
jgi:hypothetical protein